MELKDFQAIKISWTVWSRRYRIVDDTQEIIFYSTNAELQ